MGSLRLESDSVDNPLKIHNPMLKKFKEDIIYFLIASVLSFIFFFPGWLPDHTFIMTDFLTSSYPFHKLASILPIPKWEPYIFGGMPFLGAPHADIFYVNQLLRLITTPGYAASISILFHSIWAYIFSYILLRKLEVEKNWAFMLSVLYSTAIFWTSLVFSGHLAKMAIISNMPAIFWALEGTLEGKLKYSALLGLFVGITTNAGHAQLMYYLSIVVFIYAMGGLISILRAGDYTRALRVVLGGLFALTLSVLISSPFLWNQWEYIRGYSLRGVEKGLEFSKSWSLDWADFFSIFYGMYSGVFEKYWGSNPFKINSEYIGALLAFFGFIGLLSNFKNWRVISLSVGLFILFVLMTAKVNPLFPIFYNFLPMVNLFRAQAMASGVLGIIFLILSSYAFKDPEKFKIHAKNFLILGIALGLFLMMFGKSLTIWGTDADIRRLGIFDATSNDRLFAISKTVMLWIFAYMLLKNPSKNTAILLSLLGFGDNFLSKGVFYKPIKESEYFAEDEVARFFKEERGIYRVLDLGYKMDDNYLVLFGVQNVGGHHGQQIRYYYEYLGCKGLMFNPFLCDSIREKPNVLDTLGTRFIISPVGLRGEMEKFPEFSKFSEYLKGTEVVRRIGNFEILENKNYLPRFFLLCGDNISDVKVKNYDPRNGIYEVEYSSENECELVLTENYYQHWKAEVDGKLEKVERFRGTFMKVRVPEGKHNVKFFYQSPLEDLTLKLFFLGLGLSFAGIILGWKFRI